MVRNTCFQSNIVSVTYVCHKQFHISVIAHHADSCAENSVQAYEAAYDDLFNDEEWNIEEHINAIEASDPNHSGSSDILNSRRCLDDLKSTEMLHLIHVPRPFYCLPSELR